MSTAVDRGSCADCSASASGVRVRKRQYQAEHPDAVERATYLLLVHLVKDGPRRAGALADAVHSDPSTISRQIGHLVKLGYVERTADPEDGRATLLAATAEGRRVFEENRRLRNERFGQILAGWSDADRAALSAMLGRLAADIETFVGPSRQCSPCSWPSAAAASASFARRHDALISRSASARPTQVAPSTLLPGSSSL